MTRDRGGILGSLTFLLGLVFGGFLTLLLSTDEKGETRRTIKTKVKEIKKTLKDVSEKERIQEVFGEVSKEATTRYLEAKELLVAKLAGLKEAVETVDKEKYMAVVNEVTAELRKEGAMTAAQLKKLTQFLADDYKKVTKKATKTNTKNA
jgi:RecA/RadA recombinase